MKNIFLILSISLLLFNCSSFKRNNDKEKIIYIVPDTVQLWFNNVIKEPNIIQKEENIYFIIGQIERNNKILYSLALCEEKIYGNHDSLFYKNTNRYIYIKGSLYPLLSDLDQIFSTREYNNKELIDLLDQKAKIKQYYTIYEKTYWVYFDNNWGDITETSDDSKGGYRTNSPNKKIKN